MRIETGELQYSQRRSQVVVLPRKQAPLDVEVLSIKKTPQVGNSKVLVRTSDGSRIYLGGGTSVLG